MPAYDYHCKACDTRFEVTRAIGETAEVLCPGCESVAKRVFSPLGVVFKGSGFHNTDYRPRPASETTSEAPKPACAKDSGGSCASCPAGD